MSVYRIVWKREMVNAETIHEWIFAFLAFAVIINVELDIIAWLFSGYGYFVLIRRVY